MPVKKEEEAYEKIMSISRNNDRTTDNLLDFAYFKDIYRLIAIGLNKQTKLKDPQQINFTGKLENQAHGAAISSLKNQQNYFWIFAKFCKYHIKMENQKIVSL